MPIDRDSSGIGLQERGSQRQAVCGHSSLADTDEQRDSSNDAVEIGDGHRVPHVRALCGSRNRGGAGGIERDAEHDVLRVRDRLAQEHVAPCAAAARRARLFERGLQTNDGGAGLGQTRDDTGQHRSIPDARAKPGFARGVTNDHDRRQARGLLRRKPLVERPLERGDRRAVEKRHAAGERGGCQSDHRGQRHGPHCRGPKDGPGSGLALAPRPRRS